MPFLTAENSGFATLEISGFATSGNSARRKKVKSGIELFSDLFSSALEKAKSSQKEEKDRKICKKYYGVPHSSVRSEIRPRLAGLGPRRDYSIRPASA